MDYLLIFNVLVFLCFQVNAVQFPDNFVELRRRCMNENGFDSVLSLAGTVTIFGNPKSKCYMKCFMEGLNFFNEDNNIDVETSLYHIREDLRPQARPYVTQCIYRYSNIIDRCEKAYQAAKCVHDIAPEIFIQFGVFEPPRLLNVELGLGGSNLLSLSLG